MKTKYQINWTDYSVDRYGKYRKMTLNAISVSDALNKFYKKHPRGRLPSVSIVKD